MKGDQLFSRLGIRRRESTARRNDELELEDQTPSSQASSTATEQESSGGKLKETEQGNGDREKDKKRQWEVPKLLQWIPANYTYVKMKPVIRCAVAAWIALILFLIPAVQKFFGQASFLILIASVLSPPNDPFVSVIEREILILLFATASWAWSCLGIKLADLARTHRVPTATLAEAVTGKYIEAGPSIIIGVFLFIGSFAILFIKAHQGPGPYTFPSVFACITLDISLTTAALLPFPYYIVGRVVVLPLVFHSAIALLVSVVIYPTTMSAHFTTSLQGLLSPLIKALELHQSILTSPPHAPEFAAAASEINDTISQADSAMTPLAAAARLLPSDIIYGRYAPADFVAFQDFARRITGRGNGMGVYFSIIDPTRQRFPVTPATSVPGTPVLSPTPPRQQSPAPSRTASRTPSPDGRGTPKVTPSRGRPAMITSSSAQAARSGSPLHGSHSRQAPHLNLYKHVHHKLHHHAFHPRTPRFENVVGVFESQRYLNLEATRFNDPNAELYTAQTVENLSASCHDVLDGCRRGLVTIEGWMGGVRHGRLRYLWKTQETRAKWDKQIVEHEKIRDELAAVLERFREKDRHRVLDPYRPAFDQSNDPATEHDIPAHRYLFQAYVYQYHLMQFALIVIEMLDEMIRLEKERSTQRLWMPVKRIITWNNWQVSENAGQGNDEDPDTILGVGPNVVEDLGMPQRRDPDALPPRNAFESVMGVLYYSATGLSGGNILFAIKAGILTVLLALPSLLSSSAFFAYENRFVWGLIMGQITIARFQGDTTFGLLSRVMSTFLGGVVGMVMWYISTGSGRGNAYGLAAVCLVTFPFLFFARIHWPGPPMTIIVLCLTCMLVIGYSYQDVHQPSPGSPGYGFAVAWRRFVLVSAGVFAAFLMSFLPPATTIRRYHRKVLATTSNELGTIYCAIVGYANSHREAEVSDIVTSLSAIRAKLNRCVVVRTNAVYELSLRGPWPAERYQTLLEIQLQITYSLSHLISIFKHLEPAWARALLRRTRFMDTDFQGDILAVMTMISSALRNGSPLPQISPCPLLDRFMVHFHGLDVIHKESEDDYGLPRTLTMDTLQNEQYLFFCVGVSTSYGIITRLDRLMVAAKEIVGEQYYIYGIGVGPTYPKGGDPDEGGRTVVHFRPPEEV